MSNVLTYNDFKNSANLSIAMVKVGDSVRAWRKLAHMTQEALAKKAGIGRSHLASIETGAIAHPDTPTLDSLAKAFEITIDDLLRMPPRGPMMALTTDRVADVPPSNGFEVIDFYEGMTEVPIAAEVACGEPIDYSVEGETVLVRSDKAPDPAKGEFLLRARGESMIEFGVHDGDLIVAELRPGKFPASGEIIIAWYEPMDRAIQGGITMKRWVRKGGKKLLQAGNAQSPSYDADSSGGRGLSAHPAIGDSGRRAPRRKRPPSGSPTARR